MEVGLSGLRNHVMKKSPNKEVTGLGLELKILQRLSDTLLTELSGLLPVLDNHVFVKLS